MLLALLLLKEEAARRAEGATTPERGAEAIRGIDVERLVSG